MWLYLHIQVHCVSHTNTRFILKIIPTMRVCAVDYLENFSTLRFRSVYKWENFITMKQYYNHEASTCAVRCKTFANLFINSSENQPKWCFMREKKFLKLINRKLLTPQQSRIHRDVNHIFTSHVPYIVVWMSRTNVLCSPL